jgi:hypothetical protein
VTSAVIRAETEAIKQLDIPYFIRRTAERMPPDSGATRSKALKALERALFSLRKK